MLGFFWFVLFVCSFVCFACVCGCLLWCTSEKKSVSVIKKDFNTYICEVVILRRALDVQTLAQLSSDLRQQGFIKLLGFSVCLLIFCCYGYTRPVAVLHLLLPLMPPATLTVLLNQALEFLTVLHYLQWELLLAPVLFEKPFEVYCICRSLVIDASVIRNVLFCF